VVTTEKLFQKDDEVYIVAIKAINFIFIFISFYIAAILEKNSVYELFEYSIYSQSIYSYSCYIVMGLYFVFNLFTPKVLFFSENFKDFLIENLLLLFLSFLLVFFILFFVTSYLNFYYWGIFIFNAVIFVLLKFFFNYYYSSHLIGNNYIQRNILFVGSKEKIIELQKRYAGDKKSILKACILTTTNPNLNKPELEIKIPIFNFSDNLYNILEYHHIGMIWVGKNVFLKKEYKKYQEILSRLSIDIFVPLNNRHEKVNGMKSLKIDNRHFAVVKNSSFNGMSFFYKFLFDKVVSVLILIFISIPLLCFSLCIVIADGFPVLFTQQRTGWDGRSFYIYKLRTFKKNIIHDARQQVKKEDTRVLWIGKFIRRFSLDELPQFYNVWKGDMSIVGPRPHMVEHTRKYAQLIPLFLQRHSCLPGITGHAQVQGFRGSTPNLQDMQDRIDHDIWYLNHWSFWLDIKIFIKTFIAVFKFKSY
jgi:exopolysaccharide biosynthesis polyprenyl glycosylphosphotransferase